MFCAKIDIFLAVAAFFKRLSQQRAKRFAKGGKIDPILRSFRPRHARLDVAEIQFEIDAVIDLAFARHPKHFLRAEITFERRALLIGAPGRSQITYRLLIDREISHGRAVLGRHVSDRCAIGNGKRRRAFAIKFNEFSNNFLRAQHFCDVQHKIGRGDAFAQLSGQVHADDFRC